MGIFTFMVVVMVSWVHTYIKFIIVVHHMEIIAQ